MDAGFPQEGCTSNYNAPAVATFLRLLTFLRPYKRGVWLSGLLAALAMGATVAIPALTGAAINAVESERRRPAEAARAC